MLKTWVTLGKISHLIKSNQKTQICNIQTPSPNVHAVNIHIFSLVHQLQLLLALTFVPLPYPMAVQINQI